jgi:predicted enzyme related to lactoylglutathione lyase
MRILTSGGTDALLVHERRIELRLFFAVFLTLLTCWCNEVVGSSPVLPPLTSISGPRLPGKFVWADLVTDNVQTASKFYGDLFGWTFYAEGDYIVVENADHPICGMFERPRPKDESAHPNWFGYISVKNVARAQQVITKAGGRVLAAPKKFSKRGEQAVFADPEGAIFGVIKSSSGDPQDLKAEPGDWIWIQLLSRDAAKAAQLYKQIAGYEIIQNTESNRLSDFVLASEGYARATVRTIPKDRVHVKPDWLPYVRVSSVMESVERARQLGGHVLVEPRAEYLRGKVAVISDPTGAAIGLLEWSEQLLKGGG